MMAIHQVALTILSHIDEAIRLLDALPAKNRARSISLKKLIDARKPVERLRDDTYEGVGDGGHDGDIQDVRELNK